MMYSDTQQQQYFVYILLCSDQSYYIGLTNDLVKRFAEHVQAVYLQCYTRNRRPLKLVYYETMPFLKEVQARETQLKKWSRKKKEALIKQDYHKLHLLAECQNLSHCMYKDFRS